MPNEPAGLLTPFRRDNSDFAMGSGAALLRSKVIQAIMTEGATARSQGELPWRTSFGTGLNLLRHKNNSDALAELARVTIRDTLKRWAPGAQLVDVSTSQDDASLHIAVRFKQANSQATHSVNVSIPIER